MEARWLRRAYWGLAVGLHLAFGLWQLQVRNWYLVDSHEYIWVAENLRTHGWLYSGDPETAFRPEHQSKRPPVYPLWLALAKTLTGAYPALVLIQLGMSLGTLWLVWWLLDAWQVPTRRRWLVLPLLALSPGHFIYPLWLMTETWFQLLLTAWVAAAVLAWRRPGSRWVWAAAVLLVLAIFTKPVMYLFGLPFLLLGAGLAWYRRQAWLLLPALLPLLLTLGYMGWQAQRTGWFHFSAIQNLSLLQYSTHNLLRQTLGPEEALRLTDEIWFAAQENPDFAAGQQAMQAACVAQIRRFPLAYLRFHLQGVGHFFLDPGRFDLYTFFGWQAPTAGQGLTAAFSAGGYAAAWQYLRAQGPGILLLLLLVALANALKTLGLLAWAANRRQPWVERGLLLLLVGYLALLTGPSGAARFALPILPLLLVAVAAGRWPFRFR